MLWDRNRIDKLNRYLFQRATQSQRIEWSPLCCIVRRFSLSFMDIGIKVLHWNEFNFIHLEKSNNWLCLVVVTLYLLWESCGGRKPITRDHQYWKRRGGKTKYTKWFGFAPSFKTEQTVGWRLGQGTRSSTALKARDSANHSKNLQRLQHRETMKEECEQEHDEGTK